MTITTATGVVPKLGRLTKIANEFNGKQGDIIAAGVPECIRKNVIAVYRFSDRNKLAASLRTSTTLWSSELRENRHERLWRERYPSSPPVGLTGAQPIEWRLDIERAVPPRAFRGTRVAATTALRP